MEKNAAKKLTVLKRRKLREELGEEAVPKGEAITIEKMRVPDETMIEDANDEDLVGETNIDEFDTYFKRETTPKILITTNRRPNGVSSKFFLPLFCLIFCFTFTAYICVLEGAQDDHTECRVLSAQKLQDQGYN